MDVWLLAREEWKTRIVGMRRLSCDFCATKIDILKESARCFERFPFDDMHLKFLKYAFMKFVARSSEKNRRNFSHVVGFSQGFEFF